MVGFRQRVADSVRAAPGYARSAVTGLKDHGVRAVKRAPGAMWAGGTAAVGAVGRVINKDPFGVNDHDAVQSFYTRPMFGIIFTFGLALFIFDYGRMFARNSSLVYALLMAYLILSVLAFMSMRGTPGAHQGKVAFFCFKRLIFSWAVPFVLAFAGQFIFQRYLIATNSFWIADMLSFYSIPLLSLIVFYTMGWAGYLVRQGANRWRAARIFHNIIVITLIMFFIFPPFAALGRSEFVQANGVDGYDVPGPVQMFVGIYSFTRDDIVKPIIGGITGKYNSSLAHATQPYYTGTVEQSQGQRLGVFIQDVRSMQPTYAYLLMDDKKTIDPTPIDPFYVVSGRIQARTFADEFGVNLTCHYILNDKSIINKSALPGSFKIQFTGEFSEEFDFDCQIPLKDIPHTSPDQLHGQFQLVANYTFDTWGYSTWTFMDRDTMTAYRREGTDPARVLGIEPQSQARYTPGPINLGMEGISLPIGIDPDPDDINRNRIPSFGITIQNAWAGLGDVTKINYLILQVPEPLVLEKDKCVGVANRNDILIFAPQSSLDSIIRRAVSSGSLPDPKNQIDTRNIVPDGYSYYVFKDITFPKSNVQSHKTIRCPLKVINPDTGREDHSLLLGLDSSPKQFTVVARVNYDYNNIMPAPGRLRLEVFS